MKKISKALGLIAITSLLLPTGVIAGESVKVDSIEVYSPTSLPSIGLPIKDVPFAVQTATGEEIREQPGVSIADYMVNNLEGVTVNEVGGNPYQLEINYRGYNATPLWVILKACPSMLMVSDKICLLVIMSCGIRFQILQLMICNWWVDQTLFLV